MSPTEIEQWLADLTSGQLSTTELAERLLARAASLTPINSYYQADHDRQRRCGHGEVIYGSGKSPALITAVAQRLLNESRQREVLVTRVVADAVPEVASAFGYTRYDALGRTLRLSHEPIQLQSRENPSRVAVVTAGSTDLPVAREALETLDWMGVAAASIHDVGVAGPYRLLAHLELLRQVRAIVVVAGMEGALASVVGGLVACPVIAVPTSVGYGANLQGITTLLSMISSCAAGVTAVNIDGGFKGGYVAGLIATN